jgi:hypothetical protein
MSKPVFKAYKQSQAWLIPPSLEELMKQIGTSKKREGGITKTYTYYQASGCKGCSLRAQCHSGKGNRVFKINHKGGILKHQAHDRLKTEKGIYYRKRRAADVEPVFGNIKTIKASPALCSRASRKRK